jgi:hypothetical protein
VVPVAASAQSTENVNSFSSIPVTGKASNGKAFNGHFTVNHFTSLNGGTYAVGRLTGFAGHRAVKRSNVTIPISVEHPAASTAAACPILHLVLGPLHLNLLGLHVNLNQVILNITAVPGPGNLLGNLLCDVANLLNPGPGLPAAQTTGLLGVLQQILSAPSVLSL